ncbi:hypothetical protein CFC21_058010 [Triticum aestivum]|uniref:Reverse transcriptase zinc-binding domain-containing protein n=2 Tax=Triticum aestivum TaxID=4565 RepID=A0A9R1GL11_WHEAT|nr:hypothetical protein CFC21_058009 [Triticum aestivum]KAF7049483.1 hypothetical protein CFC21_058010 [Triticum aestivum]
MFHKHIAQSAACPRCQDLYEDALHLISNCSYAEQVWSSLGLPAPTSLAALHQHPPIQGLNPNIWPSVALTVSWKLRDSRNALVFRKEDHSHRTTLRNIVADFSLWIFRFKKNGDNISPRQWLNFLSSAIPYS